MKQLKIKVPKGKPWIDYSSLNLLQRCPRAYYWRHIQNVTTTEDGAALINGKAYHEAKATYLQKIIEGATHIEAKKESLLALYPIMQDITADDPKRNITVAIKTMNHYLDFWNGGSYAPLEVEIGFAVDLINFLFLGRIDSFETCPFGKVCVETKTTTIVGERWQYRGDPNLQIDGYVAAKYITNGEMPFGGVLDVIPIHDKKIIDPFRILAPRSEQMIEHWIEDIQEWWITLDRYKNSSIFPRNTENCIPLIGFSCNYRLLCKMFPQPHKMQEIPLPGEYKIEEWIPFEFDIEEVDNNKIEEKV